MTSRVVTPEAVELELPTAGAAVRALARSFDLVFNAAIMWMISAPLVGVLSLAGNASPVGPVVIGALAGFMFIIGLPVGMEILWRGRSIGKAIFGLRVIGVDGARESPRQALVRGFVAIPEIFLSLGVLAMGSIVLSPRPQRLGDLAAGTIVIRSQPSKGSTVPIAFHPPMGFEGYVRTLPVAALHDEDFVLIRDFLLRVRDFNDESRFRLAMSLATALQGRLAAPVPGLIHPETWLICVASAYQLQAGGLLADAAIGLAPLAPPMAPASRKQSRRQRRNQQRVGA
ncbi:MAG: RDD family protein [Microthrixaceae bacterium]